MDTFQDIAHHICVESAYCVSHPEYGREEISFQVIDRFQKLPPDLQNQYLSLQLRNFLYNIYYTGIYRIDSAIYGSSGSSPNAVIDHTSFSSLLKNNTAQGLNLKFYQQLHDNNCGTGYFDPGWLVVQQDQDEDLIVQKQGLTLHIRDISDATVRLPDLSPLAQAIGQERIGMPVAIRLPRNQVEPGYYIAVGNAGPIAQSQLTNANPAVSLFFNLYPEGAIVVMHHLTKQLNTLNIPFTFKVLYDPLDYRYYNSGMLTLEKCHYLTIQPIVRTIYATYQTQFGIAAPGFTKQLAPGLALAEEPESNQEGFGSHRCQLIADALIEAWQQSDQAPEARLAYIQRAFSSSGIDLNCPYLNPNSEDIYSNLVIH
jgi:hypothetical protein